MQVLVLTFFKLRMEFNHLVALSLELSLCFCQVVTDRCILLLKLSVVLSNLSWNFNGLTELLFGLRVS